MSCNKLKRILAIVLGAVAMSITTPLSAGDSATKPLPNSDRGKVVADRLCVSCHVVAQDSSNSVPAGVPTFTDIANRPQQTAQRIRGILIEPHPPMPKMHLTRVEIEDIIAYLDELRDKASGPPLLPRFKEPGPKPVYPDAT